MVKNKIAIDQFTARIHYIWSEKWFLLTSGNFQEANYNTMTVAWGSFGIMWNKPFVQVVVRPTRYTYNFLQDYESFTLCAFPERYRDALKLLGSKSGRDGDKIAETGLTPTSSKVVDAPCFEEAELIIECKKLYWDDIDPLNFLDKTIQNNYPKKDYHRIYFGEIYNIEGIDYYTL
jgi:flavin reductase (DIM6/NTAB) family NADH-FMN oxidoreductase RutF